MDESRFLSKEEGIIASSFMPSNGVHPLLQEAKMSFPYSPLPSQRSRLFFFVGPREKVILALSYFLFSIKGKDVRLFVLLDEEEGDNSFFAKNGIIVLNETEDINNILRTDMTRPYLFVWQCPKRDLYHILLGDLLYRTVDGRESLPAYIFEVEPSLQDHYSYRDVLCESYSEKDFFALNLIDDVFSNGWQEYPFYVDGDGSEISKELLKCVLAHFKPFSKDSVHYVLSSSPMERLLKEIQTDAIELDYQLFHGKAERIPEFNDIDGVFAGFFNNEEEAIKALQTLGEHSKSCKGAFLVLPKPTYLHFYEDALSKVSGCPVKVYSPLSLFSLPWLAKEREDGLFKASQYLQLYESSDMFYYPLNKLQKPIRFVQGNYCFFNKRSGPLYSSLAYERELEGKPLEDLFPEPDHPILQQLKKGMGVNFDSLYYQILELSPKSCLLTDFAEYEHIMWARRTLIYDGLTKAREKSESYFLEFSSLCEECKSEDSSEKRSAIFLDYLMGLYFLECHLDENKKPFDFSSLPDSGPIDLEKILQETSISKQQMEELLVSVGPKRLRYPAYRNCAGLLSGFSRNPSDRNPTFLVLVDKPGKDNYPFPGDYLVLSAYRKFLALEVIETTDKEPLQGNYVEYDLTEEGNCRPELYSLASSSKGPKLLIHLLDLYSLLGKGGADFSFLPALYGTPYAGDGAAGVTFRKRVVDDLKLEIHIKKALQTPISFSVSLRQAPFYRLLDGLGLTCELPYLASTFDRYGALCNDMTENLLEAVAQIYPTDLDSGLSFVGHFANKLSHFGIHSVSGDNSRIDDVGYLHLPFPVLQKSLYPYLACFLGIREIEALDLFEERLFFEKDALSKGAIAYTDEEEKGERILDALDKVFEILLSDKEAIEKIYAECSCYPFGKYRQRALLYRLAKLRLFGKETFFHSEVPFLSESVMRIGTYNETPSSFEFILEDIARGMLGYSHGEDKERYRKQIEESASRAFDFIMISHFLQRLDISPRFSSKFDILTRRDANAHYHALGSGLSKLDRMEIAIGSGLSFIKAGCRDDCNRFVVAYLYSLGLLFEKGEGLRLIDEPFCEKNKASFAQQLDYLVRFLRRDQERYDFALDTLLTREFTEINVPSTICFPYHGREIKFLVLAKLTFNRRPFAFVTPQEPIPEMDSSEGIFVSILQFGLGYEIVSDGSLIKALTDFMASELGKTLDEDDVEDDDDDD